MSEMKISLQFEGEKLLEAADISFNENVAKLSFILNSGLEISSISCNENPVPITVESVY